MSRVRESCRRCLEMSDAAEEAQGAARLAMSMGVQVNSMS